MPNWDREQPIPDNKARDDVRRRPGGQQTVPRATYQLSLDTAEGMIALAQIANTAPPRVRETLEKTLNTMYRAAMHVYATLSVDDNCAERIATRAQEIEHRMEAQHREDESRMLGELLGEFFRIRVDKQTGTQGRDKPQTNDDFEARG